MSKEVAIRSRVSMMIVTTGPGDPVAAGDRRAGAAPWKPHIPHDKGPRRHGGNATPGP